jgi:hypothetical protein
MRKIDKAYGQFFDNEELDLSGATILNCSFHACKIELHAPAWSYQNSFDDKYAFNVAAQEIWRYLVNPV